SFFFQAEDGIRDFHVTGVQTCALPIFRILMQRVHERAERSLGSAWQEDAERLRDQVEAWMNHSISLGGVFGDMRKVPRTINFMRSEERRVGKAGRSGGAPAQ